jgi:nickel superoxide dismutase
MRSIRPLAYLAIVCLSLTGFRAAAHCQLPCGIYDDGARLVAMQEHANTIAKSMAVITADSTPANQVTRAVITKDDHADQIAQIVTYYFLTQRIKPSDDAAYAKKLATAHAILVAAMKCKQTTDPKNVDALRAAIDAFHHAYMPKDHGHGHKH